MSQIKKGLQRFFLTPADPRPLAGLRIVLGLMMMIETITIWSSIDDLYGPFGFLEAGLMNAIAGTSAPSFAGWFEARGWNYSIFLHALFWIRWGALIGFIVGWKTRFNTVILWAFQSFIIFSGLFSSYGVDRYFHLFLFLLMFMPCGAAWSVEGMGSDPKPTAWARYSLRLLQICLLMTYLNAGVAKMLGFEWWNGDAVWRALHLPEFQTVSFLWMGQYPIVPKILSVATLIFETFYVIAVWIPGVGILWSLAIIGMHFGIAAFMGLVNFGITMALINVTLFLLPRLQEGWATSFAKFRGRTVPIPTPV